MTVTKSSTMNNPTHEYTIHLLAAAAHAQNAVSETAARDSEALQAYELGATYDQIGAAIGLTKPGVQNLIRRTRERNIGN